MGRAGGIAIKLAPDRYGLYEGSIDISGQFAEPVQEFKHSRNHPLVCFIISPSNKLSYLSRAHKGFKAGTDLRRINIDSSKKLANELPIPDIIKLVQARFKKRAEECLINGGYFPPKTFENVVDVICRLSEETRQILYAYSRERRELISRLSRNQKRGLSTQKETIVAAAKLAGISSEFVQEWAPPRESRPISFLEGLPKARLREDAMVANDLLEVPGYNLLQKMPHNTAVFQNEKSVLTVVLANRTPLEKILGTDLIYYNETYRSFTMVQYKAMEKEKEINCFRLPNEQLEKELVRMEECLDELNGCEEDPCCEGFRLNDNPFFIKLCSRTVFEPDNISLFPGMYIPLCYWRILEKSQQILGPQKGKRICYENVGRYFDNTAFIQLVSNAWVGTTISQSNILERVIKQTIESGKTVTLAVRKDPPKAEVKKNKQKHDIVISEEQEKKQIQLRLWR